MTQYDSYESIHVPVFMIFTQRCDHIYCMGHKIGGIHTFKKGEKVLWFIGLSLNQLQSAWAALSDGHSNDASAKYPLVGTCARREASSGIKMAVECVRCISPPKKI